MERRFSSVNPKNGSRETRIIKMGKTRHFTWQELADAILEMPKDQRDTDVTVVGLDTEEVYPIQSFVPDWKHKEIGPHTRTAVEIADGVLDDNHPFLTSHAI